MTRALTSGDLRCPTTGKVAYVSEARATTAIEKAWQSGKWRPEHGAMPKRAYQCDECGWWHMTSRRDPL